MKRSQLAINSVSTGGKSLEERLAAYHGAGFTNVEYSLAHLKEYVKEHGVAGAVRLHDQYKLRCIGGFETHLCAFSDPAECEKNHALLVANARLLGELGATSMVVGTDGWGKDFSKITDPIGDIAAAFARVAKQIQGTGVNLLIEFNWSPIVKSLRTAVDLAKRSQAKNVGVLFDPAHYHCTPTKLEMLTKEAVGYIKHVHVDDMNDKPGELSDCNADRALPGEGHLDLARILGTIEKQGYQGLFSIEMFNQKLWDMPVADASKLMYASLLPLCVDGAI